MIVISKGKNNIEEVERDREREREKKRKDSFGLEAVTRRGQREREGEMRLDSQIG